MTSRSLFGAGTTFRLVPALLVALLIGLGSLASVAVVVPTAAAQEVDEEVPPGNPVIGSDRPGDIEPENDDNYGLWGLVAVCLIGAGILLVKIERWESRRSSESTTEPAR